MESYATHAFLSPLDEEQSKDKLSAVTDFISDSLSTYAHSALSFVSDAHRVVQYHITQRLHDLEVGILEEDGETKAIGNAARDLAALDELYDTMTLNHIAKRASKSQGVALLTLYSKGFSKPTTPNVPLENRPPEVTVKLDNAFAKLIDKLKLSIRREGTHGHLPICWGVLTAALGLSLGTSEKSVQCPDAKFSHTYRIQREANSSTFSSTLEASSLQLCA